MAATVTDQIRNTLEFGSIECDGFCAWTIHLQPSKGSIGDAGFATDAGVNGFYGMAVDASGNVYIPNSKPF
jgi:hypothetical protein